jgi:hypothetical protein
MNGRKAEGRRQKAEGKTRRVSDLAASLATRSLIAAMLAVGAIVTNGCSERASPAASPTAMSKPAASTGNADSPPAVQTSIVEKADAVAAAPAEPAANKSAAARDITFDTIKFEMKKEEPFERKMVTPTIEKLTNTKVRLRGYILPSFQQSGLTQFVLVRDNMQCCFGPGAALYDCVVVQMEPGKTTDFTSHPVAVDGVFSIQEIHGSENKCLAIYHLDADRVQ